LEQRMRPPHAKRSAKPKRVTRGGNHLPAATTEPMALRVAQVAHALSMSERGVWYLISKGRLRATRIGALTLIPVTEVRALLDGAGDEA
jgi:excisionase family DNA binding protein